MLNSREIIFQKNIGNIVIEPFDPDLLNSNSYDVRLGSWICRQQKTSWNGDVPESRPIIRYNTEDGQDKMWSAPVEHAEIVLIKPGETLLAHTIEIIGGQNIITTEMRAKSTTGRYGLSVCKCAGLGDIGFISRWTMEITNHSYFGISIKVGEPIAQILFHETGEPLVQYAGRYGQGEWTPEDMLPKRKIRNEN